MEDKHTNILYIYTHATSFVKADLHHLRSFSHVYSYVFKTDKKALTPFIFLKQLVFLLVQGWKYKTHICFFAGYHSVLPALFCKWTGRKCIIILGGTDCFNYPSFRYGNFTKKGYGRATAISARNASLLLPVSENLIFSQSEYYTRDSIEQGIYHWAKPVSTPYQVISLEYNTTQFNRFEIHRQENSFLSVAFGIQGTSFVRKGIDKVLMIAAHFPHLQFTIVGCAEKDFPVQVSSNVTLIPPVPYSQLAEYYNRHQFYLQLSIAEGFPSAICEAMLCQCIPIGSSVGAIPEIIGEQGFLVTRRDDDLILDTVRKAIAYPDKEQMGQDARKHIVRHFGEGRRSQQLKELHSR